MSGGFARVRAGLALVFITGISATTLAGDSAIKYVLDLESGILNNTKVTFSGNQPVLSSDVARSGRYSMKTVLNRATSPTSYRTEVSLNGRVKFVQGEDNWYGFSVYLPSNYVADPVWEIVAQWHNIPDENLGESNTNLNPPLGLHTEKGKWTLLSIWDSRPVTNKANYEGKQNYDLGAYETNKWTDWVFHIKWVPDSTGILQVWKDGKLVIDKRGPIGFNDAEVPYFKFGLYKGWRDRQNPAGVVSERVLYHDEIRVAGAGGRYEDVAPGGALKVPDDQEPKAPTGLTIQPH